MGGLSQVIFFSQHSKNCSRQDSILASFYSEIITTVEICIGVWNLDNRSFERVKLKDEKKDMMKPSMKHNPEAR